MPKPRAAPHAGAIDFDVIVIGAGPAGMSAALVLARCRHSVLVVDSGKPRNAAARGVHAYLTRDGISPLELRIPTRLTPFIRPVVPAGPGGTGA